MTKSLLITLDFPPNTGGVANYLKNICAHWPNEQMVVLAPKQSGSEVFDNEQKYKIIRQNLLLPKPLWPQWLLMWYYAYKEAKKHKIGLIQVSHVLPCGTIAYLLQKRLKTPYIVYTHGLDLRLVQKNARKKKLARKVLKNAQKVVANSSYTRGELLKLGVPEDKIVMVYPCPALQDDGAKPEAALVPPGKKVLFTVARLIKRKGHEIVIKSLPQALKQIPDLVYVIVGDGEYKSELQKLVNSLRLQEQVIFAGRVSDGELSDYYKACDIFIMTPTELPDGDIEGFGMVYLEANSFGKPVIGSRSGGVADAVKDGVSGLLVEPGDVQGTAEAIVRLLSDQQLMNTFCVQGKKRIKEEFEWGRQVKKLYYCNSEMQQAR